MILVIDNFDSFTYNLVQILASLGKEVRVFRNDALTPEEAERLAPEAVVISPGPGTPEQAGVSIAMIRHFAGRAPVLGVCLGHQAIGAAFGARIVKAQALMHGKTSEIEHDGLTLFSGLPPGFTAARYHSLAVEQHSLPDCFEVSAWTADREIMGLRHRTFEVEGVQFHPESVATPVGRKLLENFLERRRQASAADLRSAIARTVDGKDLSQAEMQAAMRLIMSGEATQAQIGALLTALRLKGETVDEIAGSGRGHAREGDARPAARGPPGGGYLRHGRRRRRHLQHLDAAAFVAAGAGVTRGQARQPLGVEPAAAAPTCSRRSASTSASTPAAMSRCLERGRASGSSSPLPCTAR